ncbi:MAG: HNH endonuclease signature motif containing protein [Terracidiphilus sp.]|nr:HNH endonuclease signature motif containing protein [Terracidiphilus sp.]
MKQRRPVPVKVADRLMVANRHTCCICNQPRHPVEKHHINEDPSDNEWSNLAVVCRNCHGLVTQKGNLGARYSQGEVLFFKLRWEKRCAEAPIDDIESPLDELHETRLIDGDTHAEYPFDMKRSQELVFSIKANDALDLVICREEDINGWLENVDDEDEDDEVDCDNDDEDLDGEDAEDEERVLPDGFWTNTGVIECGETLFVAPKAGRYVLLLVNWDEDATKVAIDATVWAAE